MKALILSTLVTASVGANAQEMPATELDLRASYCTALDEYASQTSQDFLKKVLPDGTPFVQQYIDGARQNLTLAQNSLRKLGAYLIPRMMYVDILALATAKNSGYDDARRMTRLSAVCPDFQPECVNREMPDFHAIKDKIQACLRLDWFPF